MAINFPNSPGIGSVFTDSTSGFSYEWDGTVWKSYSASASSEIKIIDDISGSFDGSDQTFPLTSGSSNLTPKNSASLLINLGGVLQDPFDDYNVSGSNIVFSVPPDSGLTFSGIQLGPAIPVNNEAVGISSGGVLIGNAETLNFIGTGNTFAVNGSTIDVSISSGAASIMTIGVRSGTAVTVFIPSNTLEVVGRSGTINVPV